MHPTLRKRLILLVFSILVLIALFGLSVRRASEGRLLPTTTYDNTAVSLDLAETAEDSAAAAQNTAITAPTPSLIFTGTAPIGTAVSTIDSLATAQTGQLKATQRARVMSDMIKILYDDQSVSVLEGYYKQLDDFSDSFNKPGFFRVSFTDYQAKHFVIRANVLWNNAGEEISYPTAGCGFIFGYQETMNQDRVVLTLDGNVRIQNITDGNTTQQDPVYYGELDKPEGHANLILAVDRGWITVYVNNQLISRVQNENLREGWIGYAIEAGSAYDYGTKCDFKDIELWQIE